MWLLRRPSPRNRKPTSGFGDLRANECWDGNIFYHYLSTTILLLTSILLMHCVINIRAKNFKIEWESPSIIPREPIRHVPDTYPPLWEPFCESFSIRYWYHMPRWGSNTDVTQRYIIRLMPLRCEGTEPWYIAIACLRTSSCTIWHIFMPTMTSMS